DALPISPMMVLEIARDDAIGMVWAIPDVIDDGALGGELGAHPVVQRIEFFLREKAPPHPRLIGEEEDKISRSVQPADRLCRVRHPADALARAHIAVVMVD